MHIVTALFAGLFFGLGLALSGMTLPAKVLGFLDFTGNWDPSLAFVMGGALMVFGPTYFLIRNRREKPVFTNKFDVPTKTEITPRLLIGAGVFGAGWGLVGFCPGTVVTSLPIGGTPVLTVIAGMFLGIFATWGAESAMAQQDVAVEADF